jgi:hypothetical protein
MPMKETEVGCFIRFYDKKIRELNLQNVDGTGFGVVLSPSYPFLRPNGQPESSGYQIPGNEIIKITPPEITIHTLKRTLNNNYQNNFIGDVHSENGGYAGKVYSQEVEITLQITIWAEDPRQREFLKTQIERPFINSKNMRKILFEIGLRHGWEDGFVVQNLYVNHRGDIDFGQDNTKIIPDAITDNSFFPKLYIGAYEISFTTEIRDIEWFYTNTIFDINELVDSGLDLTNYNFSNNSAMIDLIVDLMQYYGITINKSDNGINKTCNEIIRESAISYGNLKNIYVDSYSFMESLEAISIGPIANYISSHINSNSNEEVGEIDSEE